jgi:hypothetical protein
MKTLDQLLTHYLARATSHRQPRKAIAEEIGESEKRLSDWANGVSPVPMKKLAALVRTLKLSSEETSELMISQLVVMNGRKIQLDLDTLTEFIASLFPSEYGFSSDERVLLSAYREAFEHVHFSAFTDDELMIELKASLTAIAQEALRKYLAESNGELIAPKGSK